MSSNQKLHRVIAPTGTAGELSDLDGGRNESDQRCPPTEGPRPNERERTDEERNDETVTEVIASPQVARTTIGKDGGRANER